MYNLFLGQPERTRSIRTPRSKWEGRMGLNVKMDLKLEGYEGVDWNDLVHDRSKWRGTVNGTEYFIVSPCVLIH
jgi:hypothetical protein